MRRINIIIPTIKNPMAQKNIIKRIISSTVVQRFLINAECGWIVLEMTDYIIEKYGLNDKISDVLPIILLIGLPIAIFLAWYLSREKEEIEEKALDTISNRKPSGILIAMQKKPWFSIPVAVVIILLLVSGIRYIDRQAKIRWAKEQALPEIEQYIYDRNFSAAFNLAQKADRYVSDDPDFKKWASRAITKLTILTDPPGAEVYIREYSDHKGEWERLGISPIDSIKLPNHSFYQMRIEKAGFEKVLAVAATYYDTLFRTLFPNNSIPPEMIYVEGYWDEVENVFLTENQGFFMDRFEVTNRQFKEFVNQGGYRNPEYWNQEFIKEGMTLTWEEAMAEFIDKTGRPGPASWEASDYPDGQGNYPVAGVSWYEAAAYAAYAGKSLPTADHWDSGAGFYLDIFWKIFGSTIIPISNFNGKGPEPVGKYQGVNIYGTFDMAGNVREWCWYKTGVGKIISGGAWDDADYLYLTWSQLPAFDRSPENGFRCVQYIDSAYLPVSAFRQIKSGFGRDYSNEDPVPEYVFEIYKNQFLYDSIGLEAIVEEKDENSEDWTIERISFNAAYNNERVIAYLYLPVHATPPYQTLIYFPGVHAVLEQELLNSNYIEFLIDYLLKNDRAVLVPVYKGTFKRNDGLTWAMSDANMSHDYTDWLIKWVKDFSRSIDYLETRTDIDTSKLGFMGWSWGGEVGGIIPAVEERLKVSILYVGGFSGKAYPEADIINYLPRITIPVLMLNGKYDSGRPYEANLKLFYDHLGTPDEDKYLLLYETGHFIPKSELIRETLNFLDQYFGPVSQ